MSTLANTGDGSPGRATFISTVYAVDCAASGRRLASEIQA